MKPKDDLDVKFIKSLFGYNPKTGDLVWKKDRSPKTKKGDIAGWINKQGYRQVEIHNKTYYAHRLMWVIITGKWPKNQIDHINGIKNDNRKCNLREATNSQNHANVGKRKHNTSGHKGITWEKNKGLWKAHINVKGRKISLKRSKDINVVIKARKEAELKYFGEFAYDKEND